MLKQRVITAAILFLLCAAVLLWANLFEFALVTAFVVLLAAYEWAGLLGLKRWPAVAAYLLGFVLCLLAASYLASLFVLLLAVVVWLLLIEAVFCFAKGREVKWLSHRCVKAVLGYLVLAGLWVALNALFAAEMGRAWLLYAMAVVWLVDIAGFFVGRRFGRRKLCERVSPKKTWEGVGGGLVLLLVYALVGAFWLGLPLERAVLFVLFTLLAGVFGIYGDLYESVLKRQAGVKDSGRLLPGHGGVLDRVDGLMAGLPVMAVTMIMLG